MKVPNADIIINGVDFGEQKWWEAVDSVTFKEERNAMSYVDITLSANPLKALASGETKWYNSANVFTASALYGKKGGSKVEVHIGYKIGTTMGPEQTLDFEGQCITLKPNYGEAESPTFTITAYDYSVFMNQIPKKEKEEEYKNMSVKEIVTEIVKRYNKVLDSEPEIDEIPAHTIAQDDQIYKDNVNQTDRDWLVAIANKINFLFYVRGKKLYFKDISKIKETKEELLYSPSLSRPSLVASGNATKGIILRSFEPKADIMNIVNNIKVSTPNSIDFGHVSGDAQALAMNMGDTKVNEIIFNVFGDSYSYQFSGDRDEESAKKAAAELLAAQSMNFMSGYGALQEGNPGLRLGQLRKAEVTGLGNIDHEFSGQYLISMTQHTINNQGYGTEFEIQRNAIGEEPKTEASLPTA